MTTFVFLRHCHSVANEQGILAGRMPGITLSQVGFKQSNEISAFLHNQGIDRIISSPLLRCIQTVEPFANSLNRRIHKDERFIEMNYGKWSGEKLKELSKKSEWKTIQKSPSSFKFPGGESFLSADRRVERALRSLSSKYPSETILIVSHGDIIKLAIRSCIGSHIDDFQRVIVDPASVTVMVWNKKERRLLHANLPITKRTNSRKIQKGLKKSTKANLKSRTVLGGGSNV